MRIVYTYSHLNGLEYLQVHQPALLEEIRTVITRIDAEACRTKISEERRRNSALVYALWVLNEAIGQGFEALDWHESRTSYWVTSDAQLIRKTMNLPVQEQKHAIEEAGLNPISSCNQTDFLKSRIAVEIQSGKYAFVAYDLFVKHTPFTLATRSTSALRFCQQRRLRNKCRREPATMKVNSTIWCARGVEFLRCPLSCLVWMHNPT